MDWFTNNSDFEELKNYPLAFRLKKLRCKFEYTQKDLANLLGCQQASVSMWERGVCKPNGIMLEKIIKLYKLPSNYFIDVEIESFK